MEIRRGIARNVRYSIEVSGWKNDTSTNHVVVFELESKPVEVKLPDSIIIGEGDDVMIAGKRKRGLLKGFAYKNISKDAYGKGPVILYMILGIIFTIIGLFTIPFFIGVAFAPAGLYMIYLSRMYSKAHAAVNL